MTLVLELPDKKEAALKAKAQAQRVSAEQYAQHVLDRDLEDSIPAAPRDERPIWEVIGEIMKDVPAEDLAAFQREICDSGVCRCFLLDSADQYGRRPS